MQNTSDWLRSFKSGPEVASKINSEKHLSSSRQAKTISITGGKGGVGKTSISIKLAKSLSAQGQKVLLIDCDYNLSNTSIKLGLPIESRFMDLLSSEISFEDCVYKDGNFHLLSACNGNIDLFDSALELQHFIIDIIYAHEKDYDYIILDCPAGLSKGILTLNAYCDHRFVVVTPDKSSITDSYSLMKVLKQKYGVSENHLVVNMVQNKKQYERVVNTLCETVENFLGGRTQIMGYVEDLSRKGDSFDKLFLQQENPALSGSFSQIIARFTEKKVSERHNYSTAVALEQEVQ